MPGLTFHVGAGFTLLGLDGKTGEVLNLKRIAGRNSGDFPSRAVFAGQIFQAMAKGGQIENASEPHGVREVTGGLCRVRSVQMIDLLDGSDRPSALSK
jgi:hypothetical protein